MDVTSDKLEQLKALLPEAFTEGKIDWEKLRLTLGDDINVKDERYVLNWAGKSDAFRAIQTPTTATLAPDREESVNFDETENIFIEGENLEVLKVLQKAYNGRIKMIYIDPPYNTGNDSFVYPDKFSESREEYLKRIQSKNEEGLLLKEGQFRLNSRDSGHYHSNWLSMMYPRLFLAKNLLRDDGVIFISIDENEVHNLRLLMNEIFGEDNFLATIVWKRKTGAGAKTRGFITLHEYVLCYFKNASIASDIEIPLPDRTKKLYNKRDENFNELGPYSTWPLDTTSMDERENLRFPIVHNGEEIWPRKQWLWSRERVEKAQQENKLVFNFDNKSKKWHVRFKGYLKDDDGEIKRGKPLTIFDGPYTQEGTKDFQALFSDRDIFPFPKPVALIKNLINCYINNQDNKEDIVLDFFGGSCTTSQAVLELNEIDNGKRKFIIIQYPEDIKNDKFGSIAEIGKERIYRVLDKIRNEIPLFAEKSQDLGFKVFKLKNSNFKLWRGDGIDNQNKLEQQLDIHAEPVRPEAVEEHVLFELMLKSGYPLTTHIEKREVGSGRYFLVDKDLAIALTHLNPEIVQDMLSALPQQVICLDNLFKDDDSLKTNTRLQLADESIAFHSI